MPDLLGALRRRRLPAALALIVCALPLWAASGAAASTVTIGPDLSGLTSGFKYTCLSAGGCTFSQGGAYASPISGVIVRWRISDSTGVFTPRVVAGNTGTASGQAQPVPSPALQEFPAAIPIKAGEAFAVDTPETGVSLAALAHAGAAIGYWTPLLANGETRAPKGTTSGFQLLVNADVQPPPGITALAPATVPVKASGSVVISGHDLTGAGAVKFGAAPATAFSVDSDTQITATVPPSTAIASVPISVTTLAGTATSTQKFSYQGCKVPKLTHKKLKAAKKKIKAGDCKLGKVSKREGATAKQGKVAGQKPKAGTVAAPGTKVKLTLKP